MIRIAHFLSATEFLNKLELYIYILNIIEHILSFSYLLIQNVSDSSINKHSETGFVTTKVWFAKHF